MVVNLHEWSVPDELVVVFIDQGLHITVQSLDLSVELGLLVNHALQVLGLKQPLQVGIAIKAAQEGTISKKKKLEGGEGGWWWRRAGRWNVGKNTKTAKKQLRRDNGTLTCQSQCRGGSSSSSFLPPHPCLLHSTCEAAHAAFFAAAQLHQPF